MVLNRIRAFPEKETKIGGQFFNVPRKKTRSKTCLRFQVARVVVHTHIDVDMHICVYVKFHFHLHLQSYLSNWHFIYVANYIHSNINVQHLLFAHVRTAATAGPDQPEPSSSPARASRPKRSVPHQRIGAAFMPRQSAHDLSQAPALKGEADSRVMVASSVQLTAGSM